MIWLVRVENFCRWQVSYCTQFICFRNPKSLRIECLSFYFAVFCVYAHIFKSKLHFRKNRSWQIKFFDVFGFLTALVAEIVEIQNYQALDRDKWFDLWRFLNISARQGNFSKPRRFKRVIFFFFFRYGDFSTFALHSEDFCFPLSSQTKNLNHWCCIHSFPINIKV